MPAAKTARRAASARSAAKAPATKNARGNGYVTPALFRFLRELKSNNEREWFNANKERFHELVRDPLLHLIEALGPGLQQVCPALRADPSPVGGSLFRIYRDTRFAKDKTPYKTQLGIHFRHLAGKDVHAPGVYVHLAPREVFVAAGIWHPDAPALKAIRDQVDAQPEAWKRATRGLELDDGDPLARTPRGFAADHPLTDVLRRRSFTATQELEEADALAPGFPRAILRAAQRFAPLNRFLAEALGLPW